MDLLQPVFSTSHTGGERKRKTKLTENQMCSGVEGWEINMSVVFGLCVSCRRDNRARLQKESGGGAHGRSDCDINDEIFDSKQTSCVRLRNHLQEKKNIGSRRTYLSSQTQAFERGAWRLFSTCLRCTIEGREQKRPLMRFWYGRIQERAFYDFCNSLVKMGQQPRLTSRDLRAGQALMHLPRSAIRAKIESESQKKCKKTLTTS
jgi:hypothetical protein